MIRTSNLLYSISTFYGPGMSQPWSGDDRTSSSTILVCYVTPFKVKQTEIAFTGLPVFLYTLAARSETHHLCACWPCIWTILAAISIWSAAVRRQQFQRHPSIAPWLWRDSECPWLRATAYLDSLRSRMHVCLYGAMPCNFFVFWILASKLQRVFWPAG